MSWVRIDDEMPGHPKFSSLPVEACWLHVCGLTYCSRYMTDGVVHEPALGVLLAGKKSKAATKRLVPELVKAGLWKPHPEGYEIHDYLKYNPSRVQIEKKREETRLRVAKAREKAKANADRNAVSNGVTGRDVTLLVTPLPAPPLPQDLDLGLVATGLGTGTEADSPPNGTNGEISKAERHRLAHVLQGKRDPENCDLCAAGQEAM